MTTSMLGPVDVPFLGSRDYLHSTTLFDAILDAVAPQPPGLSGIDYVFEKRSDRQVLLHLDTQAPTDRPVVATLLHRLGTVTVVEADSAMSRRVPYDEDAIARSFEEVAQGCRVRREQSVSFMSALVAAFKATLLRTEPDKRFIFARLKVDRLPDSDFTVEHTRVIGKRFYEGRIIVQDQPLGFIYFGVWS